MKWVEVVQTGSEVLRAENHTAMSHKKKASDVEWGWGRSGGGRSPPPPGGGTEIC
jgi:hypothetical protein